MNNSTQKDIDMGELLGMWLIKVAMQYRRWQIKREIMWTERHLELSRRAIADWRNSQLALQAHLMQLKAERNSL